MLPSDPAKLVVIYEHVGTTQASPLVDVMATRPGLAGKLVRIGTRQYVSQVS